MNPVALWDRWVRYANRPMDTRPLALFRIAICALVLWDQLQVARFDLFDFILVSGPEGGLVPADLGPFHLAQVVGPEKAGLYLWVTVVVCFSLALVGLLFTPATLLGVVAYAQLADIHFVGDRAIDHVLRTALLFFAFSGAGRAYTLSRHKAATAASWPADCIRVLMVSLYLNAGVVKLFPDIGRWLGWEGLSPVYRSITQPAIAKLDAVSVLWLQPFWWFTSWMTILMEMTAPLLLFKKTRRAWAIHGAALHIGLWLWVDLGIFSPAMLCFYFLICPDLTVDVCNRVEARLARWRTATA